MKKLDFFFRNTGQVFWIHAKILTQPRYPYMIPHCFHCTLDTANLAVQVTRFDRNPPTLCNIAPKVYNAGCCKGNLGIVKICRSIYLIYIFMDMPLYYRLFYFLRYLLLRFHHPKNSPDQWTKERRQRHHPAQIRPLLGLVHLRRGAIIIIPGYVLSSVVWIDL